MTEPLPHEECPQHPGEFRHACHQHTLEREATRAAGEAEQRRRSESIKADAIATCRAALRSDNCPHGIRRGLCKACGESTTTGEAK